MQIYYFTRTGKSEKIAKEIAAKNNSIANKIDDEKNWSGSFNFIKAGAMAARKDLVNIECEKPKTDSDIVLVFPLWAGTFPPAIRIFLQNVDIEKITAVILSGGSSLNAKEKSLFKNIYEVKGKDNTAPFIKR